MMTLNKSHSLGLVKLAGLQVAYMIEGGGELQRSICPGSNCLVAKCMLWTFCIIQVQLNIYFTTFVHIYGHLEIYMKLTEDSANAF